MTRKTKMPNLRKLKKKENTESKAHPKDGERLKIIRRLHNKTQEDFAAEFDVSVGTVGNYEGARSEIPPSFFRGVFTRYNLNPTPLNPEEDPRRLLAINSSNAIGDVTEQARSIRALIKQMQRGYATLTDEVYSPARCVADKAIHTVFSTSTVVCVTELVTRYLSSEDQSSSFASDILFAGAFFMIIFLFVPMILSIPWGIKTKPNNEA